jgi:hypothetical protein
MGGQGDNIPREIRLSLRLAAESPSETCAEGITTETTQTRQDHQLSAESQETGEKRLTQSHAPPLADSVQRPVPELTQLEMTYYYDGSNEWYPRYEGDTLRFVRSEQSEILELAASHRSKLLMGTTEEGGIATINPLDFVGYKVRNLKDPSWQRTYFLIHDSDRSGFRCQVVLKEPFDSNRDGRYFLRWLQLVGKLSSID